MQTIVPSLNDPHRSVRVWLYALAVLITVMVLVGGATRLTDSGLSITQWDLISGFLPPLSLEGWQIEFAKYQTTDEFKLQNSAMTLIQFKTIYWWEWGHRFLGRLIGLAVLLPMIYFWIKGRLERWMKRASLVLFVLVCFQGFLGWWMVKSGLVDRVDVSQIRLAVHLTTALIFFAATIWFARSLARHSEETMAGSFWQGGLLVFLILVQIFAGGLVAGLDAGMAYNTWPKMNGEWVPAGLGAITPVWKNLTDNAMTVQFVHRLTAYVLWVGIFLHMVSMLIGNRGTTHSRRAIILFILTTLQACIGIVTLLLQVPVFWALVHQFGGVVVLAFATAHWRAMRPRKETAFLNPPRVLNPVYGTI